MEIEVRFFGPFREAVGEERVTVAVPDGTTCRHLLERVEEDHPALVGRLLGQDESGAPSLAGQTVVTRNKRDVRHLDKGLDTPLADGDVVRAIPSVYGG